ncbi:hypothetical protein BKA80DRAFT_133823 [Phyllosticta citrichinensis]
MRRRTRTRRRFGGAGWMPRGRFWTACLRRFKCDVTLSNPRHIILRSLLFNVNIYTLVYILPSLLYSSGLVWWMRSSFGGGYLSFCLFGGGDWTWERERKREIEALVDGWRDGERKFCP